MGYIPNWIAAAEYSFEQMMKTPLMQRVLAIAIESEAAVLQARLAAGIAQLRTSSLLIGSAGLVLTLAVPIAVWVGVFVAMGAGYAEARTLVRNENFQSGFSQGFVMGLLKWEWQHVVSRFFRFGPGQINVMDESLSYIAANSYNEGLRSGFLHARIFDDETRKALLNRLKSFSPSTGAGQWNRLNQVSYVVEVAGAGRRHNFFRAA